MSDFAPIRPFYAAAHPVKFPRVCVASETVFHDYLPNSSIHFCVFKRIAEFSHHIRPQFCFFSAPVFPLIASFLHSPRDIMSEIVIFHDYICPFSIADEARRSGGRKPAAREPERSGRRRSPAHLLPRSSVHPRSKKAPGRRWDSSVLWVLFKKLVCPKNPQAQCASPPPHSAQ